MTQEGGGIIYPASFQVLARWTVAVTLSVGVGVLVSKRYPSTELIPLGLTYTIVMILTAALLNLDSETAPGFDTFRVLVHICSIWIAISVLIAYTRRTKHKLTAFKTSAYIFVSAIAFAFII